MIESATRSRLSGHNFDAFDRAYQTAQKNHDKHAIFIGQWEVLITYFKHSFLIPAYVGETVDPALFRTGISQLLAMGETIFSFYKFAEAEMVQTGYSKDFVIANVRYLREKYEEFYFQTDTAQIESDSKIISDALANAA